MKIKTPVAIVKTVAANRKIRRYEKMIKASQDKIGPYVAISYTVIYA